MSKQIKSSDSDLDTRTRLRQAELLLSVSKTIAAFDTLDDMLLTLVKMTTDQIGGDRGSIFLNDPDTGELYTRVAQGDFRFEIRILNSSGIAGHVFQTGEGIIVPDAYADERFNQSVDKQTGYRTNNILSVPIKTVKGEIIGVTQVLNKKKGKFTKRDLFILEAMSTQASIAIQSSRFIELMQQNRKKEMEFFDIVSDITSEIDLTSILQKVMAEATRMLNAERSTLFLNDFKTSELFSKIGEGLGATEIRFPNNMGIAGTVFTSGETVKIPYAYADLRFNPTVDRQTGFFTRSILCVPLINKEGKRIGVTQVLNKRGGPFTDEDEGRLRAFTAQVSIALENAKLFEDIQIIKNYNESILESMPSGVITLDDSGKIITCNTAGLNIFRVSSNDILKKKVSEFFMDNNSWINDKVERVRQTQKADETMDAEIFLNGKGISVNMTIMPLLSLEDKKLGSLIMFDDISNEKRLKSTMSRYMDPNLADRVLGEGEDILGGKSSIATVLFSDIRSFTTLTEELGAQGTVSLLNEYFTIMVDCIQAESGMLDKFIGDAIMAAFGVPIPGENDEDSAVRSAISMMKELGVFNIKRRNDGKKPIDIGIGINTDDVVSGNIGSPKRMDYTLIGDGVNLASRLESACKQYGAHILISENTCNKLHGAYRTREIDRVVVKGKTEPVAIYEILDYHTSETFPHIMDTVGLFGEGLAMYRNADWDSAIRLFGRVLQGNPNDKLSQIYLERCDYLKSNPPDGEWDGVWIMESK